MEWPLSFSKFSNRLGVKYIPSEVFALLDNIFGLRSLSNLYDAADLQTKEHNKLKFFEAVLKELDVRVEVQANEVDRIPRSGPLIVMANHPFGGLDGIALGSLLTKVRADFKLLVNQELDIFKALNPWVFKVDILSGHSAKSKNFKAMVDCTRYLKGEIAWEFFHQVKFLP